MRVGILSRTVFNGYSTTSAALRLLRRIRVPSLSSASLQPKQTNSPPHRRYNLLPKPPIPHQPNLIPRRRMRQREIPHRQVRLPRPDGLAQRRLAALAQVVRLRIAPDQQGEADIGELRVRLFVPPRSAFRTRRHVARGRLARIAEAHRHDGHLRGIVELHQRQAEPVAQPLTGLVAPGECRSRAPFFRAPGR